MDSLGGLVQESDRYDLFVPNIEYRGLQLIVGDSIGSQPLGAAGFGEDQ